MEETLIDQQRVKFPVDFARRLWISFVFLNKSLPIPSIYTSATQRRHLSDLVIKAAYFPVQKDPQVII